MSSDPHTPSNPSSKKDPHVNAPGTPPPCLDCDRPVMKRRNFLARAWMGGVALVGAAGIWTSWDLLKARAANGFGGKVRALPKASVPDTGIVEVSAARSYLTSVNGEVVALSQKCTHLGCRVPWCESSGQFECPCHGSKFNRAGEYRAGPAPRGMDRYAVEENADDGLLYIDTSSAIEGAAPGGESIDEPERGPSCGGGE